MKGSIIAVLCLFITSIALSQDINTAKDLLQKNNLNEAKSLLEKMIDKNKYDAEAHFYLGQTLVRMKKYSDASDEFEEAVKINYNNAEYHFWLAQAYGQDAQTSSIFTKMRLAPKIKDEYLKTVQIDPKHIGGHIGLINFYRIAPGIMGGSMEKADAEIKTLISLDEKQGHYTLAHLYTKDKNFTKAEEEYKFLESKYGNMKDFYDFYNDYGYLLINCSRAKEAIQKFKKQVELAPNNPNAYDSLGDGYVAAGNKTEAKAAFKKAVELEPNFEATKKKLKDLGN